jgi:hypothetical protein
MMDKSKRHRVSNTPRNAFEMGRQTQCSIPARESRKIVANIKNQLKEQTDSQGVGKQQSDYDDAAGAPLLM